MIQETPEARVAHMNDFARTRHPGLIGIDLLSCTPNRVTGRLPVTQPLVGGTGFLWGAVVVTLADWLCACGMGLHLPTGTGFTTLELKANFLGSVREGGAIHGEAVPLHVGRRTHVWDVRVTDESNQRPIALFRCTQMVLLPKVE